MFVRPRDMTIHVAVDGPPGAPVLLLLHSLGTSHAIWDQPAQALSASFRVLRPDLRGHGLSDVTSGPGSLDIFAQDALDLLDALGHETAHVAGVSIGGMVAQVLAARAPERVLSLVLCDTALAIPPAENWIERARLARAQGMASLVETVVERWVTAPFLHAPEAGGLRNMLRRTDPEGYAAAAEAIAAAELSATASAIRSPCLVLVGEQDRATDVHSARRLAAAIAGARLEVLADAAHIPTVEQPEAVTAAMRAFLAEAPSDTRAAGMVVRRQVLGEAHVDRATAAITALDRDFQDFITRTAWGSVWTRPGLDRRTRSLLTLAMMAALGHHEEFALHVRASRNTGVTETELVELLIQVAAYAGIPAANAAVRIAKATIAALDEPKES